MFVDTHAHLFYPNFNGEIDQIIDRAINAGIEKIIIPATDLGSSKEAINLANKYEMVYAAIGVHPHDSKEWNASFINILEELSQDNKVIAIGEIGLDYYYDFSPKEIQIEAFIAQIELALKINKPIIVHNRDANNDIMNTIRKYKDSNLRAQFHCFAGTLDEAKELIRLGHFISFTGNVTFKKAETLRNLVSKIELENLLLETDSPFMTPVPYRGKRNEPSYLPLIAETISDIHNLGIDDVSRTTNFNVYKLFGIGSKPKVSFVYQIGNSLYVNITNRCNADCIFCDRKGEAVIKGYNLKMNKSEEPEANEYIKLIGDPKKYKEVVFCGYGEPTIRWNVVKSVAKFVKENGGSTRLNTDGHGNFINKKDITPELQGLIDVVSISLNSTDPIQYSQLMRVKPEMHNEMLEFSRKAKNYTKVVLSIVGLSEVDKEKAKNLAINELGVEFRERGYF